MQNTEILLFAVVAILTILLVVVGVQVFLVLRQAHKTLKTFQKVLEMGNLKNMGAVKDVSARIQALQEAGRRFFHKGGKPLSS